MGNAKDVLHVQPTHMHALRPVPFQPTEQLVVSRGRTCTVPVKELVEPGRAASSSSRTLMAFIILPIEIKFKQAARSTAVCTFLNFEHLQTETGEKAAY